MMENIGLLKLLGLPDTFANALLLVSLALLLVPYCSGKDFGVFKVPEFSAPARTRLRYGGPLLLLVTISAFLPIYAPLTSPTAAADFAAKGFEAFNLGHLSQAHYSFRRAAELAPSTQDWQNRRASWFYNAGLAAERQEKWSAAELSFRDALKFSPEDPQMHASLANILMQQQHWKESEQYFEASLARATKWPLWGGTTREEVECKIAAVKSKRSSPCRNES